MMRKIRAVEKYRDKVLVLRGKVWKKDRTCRKVRKETSQ